MKRNIFYAIIAMIFIVGCNSGSSTEAISGNDNGPTVSNVNIPVDTETVVEVTENSDLQTPKEESVANDNGPTI